jgi:death on curing protein
VTQEREPEFLTRAIVDAIHEEQINQHGGIHGLRDEGGLESAIAQPMNVYHYGNGDV